MCKIIDLNKFKKTNKKCLPLVIGYFGSLHKAHKRLFDNLQEKAFNILTFKPFISKKNNEIYDFESKLKMLKQLKPKNIYVFDINLNNETCLNFINKYLKKINPKSIIVGSDFKIGNDFKDIKFLKQYFNVKVIKYDEKYKTREIRKLLESGKIQEANSLLCLPYMYCGKWSKGSRNGRKLSFRTINVINHNNVCNLKYGSYVASIQLKSKIYHAVAFYGKSKTIKNSNIDNTMEVHVIDKYILPRRLNLFVRKNNIKVCLYKFIEENTKFASQKQLCDKIKRNVKIAKVYFEKYQNIIK